MSTRQHQHADSFRALHAARGGFIMPNAWDAGSARVIASEGFLAIATTSAGIAFSQGRQDYMVERADLGLERKAMLARMAEIVAASPVPVNGDLEAGYGDRPETVAETVALAIDIGLAGGNIEDKIPFEAALYDEAHAARRIAAAKAGAGDNPFVLTARTDAVLLGLPDAFETAIRRAALFIEAGADCIFIPGVEDPGAIGRLAREISAPINIVAGLTGTSGNVHAMLAAGAGRVSLGGTLARAALGLVRAGARELRETGGLSFAEGQLSTRELNRLFA